MDLTATTALRRMGNSTGMIVPKVVLAAMGAREGERLDIGVENGRLVIARAGNLPDEGGVMLTVEETRLLTGLAAELNASASRMVTMLNRAIDQLREANDPGRDEIFRRRAEKEIEDDPSLADLPGLFK